jgi:Ca2+-binding RTX toxin-like protein
VIFGDNVNFDGDTTVGTASGNDALGGGTEDDTVKAGPGNDVLDGGADTDDCDGETGIDTALRCESLTGVP